MTPATLSAVMEATWPAADYRRLGPWMLRDGQGGGKRVSAATSEAPWTLADITDAETAMVNAGQDCLFCLREGDQELDRALELRGYRKVDPVLAYIAPVGALTVTDLPPMAAFAHWPPLAICQEIWAEGGIGPARLAVMDRAVGPKCAILSRANDRPTGTAFVAIHANIAMLHALEVRKDARRQGSAHNIMRAAAIWAQQNGANDLSVVVTEANSAARALYTSLGMEVVGHYHYRQK